MSSRHPPAVKIRTKGKSKKDQAEIMTLTDSKAYYDSNEANSELELARDDDLEYEIKPLVISLNSLT